ncbi:calcium-binding protein [Paractinoplanes lichenicola]|uniref:Calcium-binding protein n=1 Tax=Paractinoplanes lichenicola TaxID=2802976 RepID=A0ABS1VYT5_9ACTN|nr:calcium-binding protein [Actinoplanes lichenicola]MBL7259651.1 calcium-binding protein [Actinoplanes lichenicola]
MKRAWIPGVGLTAVAIGAAGWFALPAEAATGGLASVTSSTVVQYAAAAKAVNNVVITRSGRTITIDDRVAVRAGKGCAAVKGDSTKVRCTTAATPGQVRVFTYDGNDTIVNNTNVPLTANGGPGSDRITGGSAADYIMGDVLGAAGSGNDAIWGLGGDDKLFGGGGDDAISGGDGNDSVNWPTSFDPGLGNDRVYGGNGDDFLLGGAGNDQLFGGPGNDTLQSGSGSDRIEGGTGKDYLDGGADLAPDVMLGGPGEDTVAYLGRTKPLHVSLDGVSGDDGEAGERDTLGADVENINGGKGDDVLVGNALANRIMGLNGNDTVRGGAGNDEVGGGDGADKVYGEAGDDVLTAGEEWEGAPNTAVDLLDGGPHGPVGDRCIAPEGDTMVNCELFGIRRD